MLDDLDDTFKFRVNGNMLKAFNAICKKEDRTGAQILRAAIRDYIALHGHETMPLTLTPSPSPKKPATARKTRLAGKIVAGKTGAK